MDITSEHLAFWFLRLNGFLTIPNFVVHPERPNEAGRFVQQTDVDVLGVRFPFRAENRYRPMPDFPLFAQEQRVQVVISEVKTAQCALNGPWTNPELQNMQKVLCAGGFQPAEQSDAIADALYTRGIWEDGSMVIRIVCFGRDHNKGVAQKFRDVPQLTWAGEVLPFVFERFTNYHLEKRMHEQWDPHIKGVFEAAKDAERDLGAFLRSVNVVPPVAVK